jgi:hypothetical protein
MWKEIQGRRKGRREDRKDEVLLRWVQGTEKESREREREGERSEDGKKKGEGIQSGEVSLTSRVDEGIGK